VRRKDRMVQGIKDVKAKFLKMTTFERKAFTSQAWWCISEIPALGKLRQEDLQL
jgi:hypothetical protein